MRAKGENTLKIRLEEPRDYQLTEELTRDAFWNKYHPGCSEHYVLHQFRDRSEFVPELDYVMEEAGHILAHIMYARAEIQLDTGGVLPIVVFGPVSVRPDRQREGIGSAIIHYTMEQAKKMGFGAVAITGNPEYYKRFGFVSGHSMGIYYGETPRTEEVPFFLVRELIPGYLKDVSGTYFDPAGYQVSQQDVDEFDRRFPPREKLRLPGQLE